MASYTNLDIHDAGQAALGMTAVTYMLVKLTTAGGMVQHPALADVDQILRFGWVAIGVTLNPFGDGNEIYWNPELWLDFNLQHWPFIPTRNSGVYAQMAADTVRWHLTTGSHAKLFVFGS